MESQVEYVKVEYKPPQENSPLLMLPSEVLEIILKFLEPLSLVRLSCTCSRFYNLVNQTANWRTWTTKVVENSCMPHLSSTLFHFGIPTLEPQKHVSYSKKYETEYLCKQIFHCMQFWNMINKWDYSLTYEISIEKDNLTSVDIAGQNVVFGTCQGGLGLWNPDTNPDLQVLCHFKYEVLTVLVRLCSDGLPRYQIIAKCRNRSTCLYDLEENVAYNLGSTNCTGISFCQSKNVFYEWDPDRGLLSHLCINKKIIRTKQFPRLPFHPVVAVYGDNEVERSPIKSQMTQIFTHIAVSRVKGPAIVKYFESPSGQISQRYDEIVQDNNLCIYKAYIWPGSISFSITAGSLAILTVGYNVNKIRWLSCRCTSAYLFGNIFIVGTSAGSILCYTFKTPSDLLNLDPENYKIKLETGVSESVMYVGIRVQNEAHPLPDIVAATRSKLFCFRAA